MVCAGRMQSVAGMERRRVSKRRVWKGVMVGRRLPFMEIPNV